MEELWPQGGCQEHGWGRLGLLTSTWLLQKRARLSEQDLCEECLKSRRGVQIFCDGITGQPWGPTGTITYDEGTESFQVPEVQPVENSDASAPKRMKIQQRYLEKVGFTPSCIKCRALQRGDKTVTTGHSPECRIRVEAEMMKHEDLRDELEKANNRINEYIAKKIEENWTEKVSDGQ